MSERAQRSCIHIELPKSSQQGRIEIYKGGLMGGGTNQGKGNILGREEVKAKSKRGRKPRRGEKGPEKEEKERVREGEEGSLEKGQQGRTELGNLSILSTEVVGCIFSYVDNPYILNGMLLNRTYYRLITGYEFATPNLVGVEHRPNHITVMNRTRWTSNKEINFRNLSYTTKTIPSCGFYLFVGETRNLPQTYWHYLSGTSVHTVDLHSNKIGDQGAEGFAKHLHGTSVHTVDLRDNKIGSQGTEGFAKHLHDTSVHKVDLRNNNIGNDTRKLLKKQYPHIKWEF